MRKINPTQKKKKKKKNRSGDIGFIVGFLIMLPVYALYNQYEQEALNRSYVLFWFLLIAGFLFLYCGVRSLITKEAWAHGVSVSKEKNPFWFALCVMVYFLFFIFSLTTVLALPYI